MELNKLVRILRKSWILIAIFALLGVVGGAVASLLTPVQYASATRLFVAVQIAPGSTTGDLVQGNNFAVQKVLSYIDVATSPRVLDPVIADLGLDTTSDELAKEVTATVEPNSVVIELVALAPTSAGATELARSVADSFANVVVNQLETPADGSASPVKVEVLAPATPSDLPALPQVPLNLALGLVIGLVIGFLVALAMGLVDRRVHSRSDIERVTGLPVLGSIGADPKAKNRPLVVREDPYSAGAEAFRVLRTNLQFVGFEGRTRSLLVTSASKDEGKSTTIANLAIVLAEGGSSVALVDADLRMPRLEQYMGRDGGVGLSDVLVGRTSLDDALQAWGPYSRLMLLPAGRVPPNPSELLGSTAMADLLARLTAEFDYVLIDSPSVLAVTDAAVLGRLTAGTILVAGANRVREDELRAAISALETAGSTIVGVVATLLPTRGPDADPHGGQTANAVRKGKVRSGRGSTAQASPQPVTGQRQPTGTTVPTGQAAPTAPPGPRAAARATSIAQPDLVQPRRGTGTTDGERGASDG